MSNLSPDQFRHFVAVSDAHRDSTYPLEAGGANPYAIENTAYPDPQAARARVRAAKPFHRVTGMRKSRLN